MRFDPTLFGLYVFGWFALIFILTARKDTQKNVNSGAFLVTAYSFIGFFWALAVLFSGGLS